MKAEDLAAKTKKDLLEQARKLDLAGRSAMSKDELVRAIQKATRKKPAGVVPPKAALQDTAKAASSARQEAEKRAVEPPKASGTTEVTGAGHTPAAPSRPSTEGSPTRPAETGAPAPARPQPGPPPAPRGAPGSGWQPPRRPHDGPRGPRRGIPPQDPAMKLSRVEEIRRSSPDRGRPGRHTQGGPPRNLRPQVPPIGGRPGQGPRRDMDRVDRYGKRLGPEPRGGSPDRRPDLREPRRPLTSDERSLQAREHLKRSGEARRDSGYVPQYDRTRDARRPVEPPRPAPIPERLSQAVPPARVVPAPQPPPPARPPRREDATATGHPVEMPAVYGKDRLSFMVRDPHWIHAYWEVTQEAVDRARAELGDRWEGHRWILRVAGHPSPGEPVGQGLFDIDISPNARNWYVQVPVPGIDYDGMIGILTRDGTFYPLAKSNRVTTPPDRMSTIQDVEWASTKEEFERLYALSGGNAAGMASVASAELGQPAEEKHREAWFSGMLGSMASGVRLGARERGFWFQVDTELIVYGATEPDARVTVQGRSVQLRADGTFSLRFQLPDGVQEISCSAESADGGSSREIKPIVTRQTTSSERDS